MTTQLQEREVALFKTLAGLFPADVYYRTEHPFQSGLPNTHRSDYHLELCEAVFRVRTSIVALELHEIAPLFQQEGAVIDYFEYVKHSQPGNPLKRKVWHIVRLRLNDGTWLLLQRQIRRSDGKRSP